MKRILWVAVAFLGGAALLVATGGTRFLSRLSQRALSQGWHARDFSHNWACGRNVAGIWRAENDGRFRYKVTDQGDHIVLEPLFPIGGQETPYARFTTTLRRAKDREPSGTTETVYTEGGKSCPLSFHSSLSECTADSMMLGGETSFDVKMENCEVQRTGAFSKAKLVRESK